MSVSLEWQKVLTVGARTGAALSLLGSAWICQHVLLSPKKRGRVYHRMLLGMSSVELIRAFARFCLQWWVPAEEYGWWGARGTRFTCIMQGFLFQLSLVSSLYNAGLSLCCLLTVRFGWSEKKTARQLEPWVHWLSWAFGIGLAIAGIPLELYNSIGFVCFIAPWPPNCTQSWRSSDGEGTCERGDNATLYKILLYQLWHWLAFLCTAVSMFMVYWRLRYQENRNRRYNFAQQVMMQQQQQEEGPRMTGLFSQQRVTTPALNQSTSRQFAKQALLYVLVFYTCHIFPSIWMLHNFITGGNLFGVLVLSAFTAGLEGFLNFLVYIRPKYIRLRRERADLQAWRVLNEIVGGNSTVNLSPRRQTRPIPNVRNGEQNPEVRNQGRSKLTPDSIDGRSPSATGPQGTANQEGNGKEQEHGVDGTDFTPEGEGEQLDEY